MKPPRILLWTVVVWCLSLSRVNAADVLPDWLAAAVATEIPAPAGSAPAVILLADTDVKVDERGLATTRVRFAVRLTRLTARDHAVAVVSYLPKHDRVGALRAWVVRGGRIEKLPRDKVWADVAAIDSSTVFGESRAKVFSATDVVVEGDVFAYETEVQEPMLVAQLYQRWGSTLPCLTETYRLSLPRGFTVAAKHLRTQPEELLSPDGRTTTWTVRNQPFHPDEPFALHHQRINGRTMVKIVPPPGTSDFRAATFHSWTDVVRWAEGLSAGQCDIDAAMEAKVRELTAGATTTLERIRLISRYVQTLRYVALDKDIGKGGGYKPRRASHVFAQGYGDCKDKANLLRSLLQQVGVTSHLVLAYSGEAHVPDADFPSPLQFNHAISAIVVDGSIDLPSVVQTSTGERLLLFDATHPHVLVGDLPESLQGSRVLVLTPASEGLLDVPRLPPQTSHRLDRTVELAMHRDGTIEGGARVMGSGNSAARWRAVAYNATEAKEYEKAAMMILGDALRGATLSNAKPAEGPGDQFGMSCDIAGAKFLQPLAGGRAVVRLDLLSRSDVPNLSAKERMRPVLLKPLALEDRLTLAMPEGSSPEELPGAAALESDFGTYTRTVDFADGKVEVRRRLTLRAMEVPVGDYAKLRKFLSDVAKADRASLLLRMTP